MLRWAGIPFEERLIRLDQPGYGRQAIDDVVKVSPNGRVPCLHADGLVIWDSLAIAEWAAEEAPRAGLWPADRRDRAEARSAVAEMHSGFPTVRRDLSMNLHRRVAAPDWPTETRAEIARLDGLWKSLRDRFAAGGRWLFGARGIADAFYAPVAGRMRTYGVSLSAPSERWCEAVFKDPDFQEWESDSLPDSWDAAAL